ncbi:MAG TPA: GNAT family N-acetyltransferase [Candidatus Rifleibacterium sp.]|nr:GNAT family N-acetyltransferase [Candidatus Rifleibacterium sp.]HPT46328.1 GNAT family N-acetyltransferase [Candidatus Rifleibacterium sp.]
MSVNHEITDFFRQNELLFVDEIDRLRRQPSLVSVCPGNALQNGGWLFMAAESASGDWNLARLLGDPHGAIEALGRLPDVESQLLVPEPVARLFARQLLPQPALLNFVDAEVNDYAVSNGNSLPTGFNIEIRFARPLAASAAVDATLADQLSVFLLADGQVQGYVKTIRHSQNFSEVYIELKPAVRGRGLAPELLRQAVLALRSRHRRLFYSVSADNAPSLATARRVGLQPAFKLARFLKPQSG